jgi:hypothetical protein
MTDPLDAAHLAPIALDAVRWLGGEERISGAIGNEEDVPVTHTRKQDLVWFYSSILLAPAAVLALGFLMTRRRRRAGKTKPAEPMAPSTTSESEAAQ